MTLNDVISKWGGCTRCALHGSRANAVVCSSFTNKPGENEPLVLVIGEAPGASGDELQEGFAGRSGQFFRSEILNVAGARLAFFANVVCCRPPRNRDPLSEEIKACEQHLADLLVVLCPDVVLAVGRLAAREVMGRRFKAVLGGAKVVTIPHTVRTLRLMKARRDPEFERCVVVVRDALRAQAQESESLVVDDKSLVHKHIPVRAGEWVNEDGEEVEELWVCSECAEVVVTV